MKIGLIIYETLGTVSGGYLYDRKLVQILREQGNQVHIISLPWRTYAAHLLDNFNVAFLGRIIRGNYDLLLQDELNHPSLFKLNWRLRRRMSTPIVSIVHHLRCHEEHPPILRSLYRQIEQRYLRSVDGFVVNSWTTRRAVEDMLTEPRPIQVAYPASDHLAAPPPTQVRNHIVGEDTTKPVLRLVFVGNVIPRKGLHTVIEGLALLRRADYTILWKLDVVGSLTVNHAYAAQIQRQVADYELTDRITFHGRISDQKLSFILMAGNILVAPSFEGFGIVYLEAMRHGLCPIAATAGAASEIVQHGKTGFQVAPGDSAALANLLRALVQHPERLQTCRQGALDRATNHPVWSESFGNTYQWLREIINRDDCHDARL